MLQALVQISLQLKEGSVSSQAYAYEEDWTPPVAAVVVNGLWYLALVISLVTAVFAMLVKQSIIAYRDSLTEVPEEDVRGRYLLFDSLQKWKVAWFVTTSTLR